MKLQLDDKKVLILADDYRRVLMKHLEQFSTVEIRSITWPVARPIVSLGDGAASILLRFDITMELTTTTDYPLAGKNLKKNDVARAIFGFSGIEGREWVVPSHQNMKITMSRVERTRDHYHPYGWNTEAHLAVFTHLTGDLLKKIVGLIKRDPKWV